MPETDEWSLKRLAWAYGCAPKGSDEEEGLRLGLMRRCLRESGLDEAAAEKALLHAGETLSGRNDAQTGIYAGGVRIDGGHIDDDDPSLNAQIDASRRAEGKPTIVPKRGASVTRSEEIPEAMLMWTHSDWRSIEDCALGKTARAVVADRMWDATMCRVALERLRPLWGVLTADDVAILQQGGAVRWPRGRVQHLLEARLLDEETIQGYPSEQHWAFRTSPMGRACLREIVRHSVQKGRDDG